MTTNPTITTTPEASTEVVRRFVDEILNQRRFDVIADIVHSDYRYEGPDGTRLHGQLELEQLVSGFHGAFSDFHATITSEIANGAHVAMTMTLTGTHDGAFDGLAPTGAQMLLPIAVFTRVEHGRIIEDREFYDTATLLAQLDVTTPATGDALSA